MTDREWVRRNLARQVEGVLHQVASAGRGYLHLRRVSLTLPDSELVVPMDAATTFAYGVARELPGRSGALLVMDVSPSGREHWYGLALTQRSDFDLDQLWHHLAGHHVTREHLLARVRAVTGEGGDWFGPDPDLHQNLSRVCRYALKPLPRGHRFDDVRVIATGPLESAWGWACVPPADRVCARRFCLKLITSKRKHARFCSPTCQKAAHKRARETQAVRL